MKKTNLLITDRAEQRVDVEKDLKYIFVTGFDDPSVTKFYESFLKFENDRDCKVIPVVVSSYGGSCHALLSMLDILYTATKPVATIGLGKAMSCGAILLSAGTKGYRYGAPNVDVMLHEVASSEFGKNSDLQNGAKATQRMNDVIFAILAKNSDKKDTKYFQKILKEKSNVDWFLSAKECKELGIIDHVQLPSLGAK